MDSCVPRPADLQVAIECCRRQLFHFINTYCIIQAGENWIPFRLWEAQRQPLQVLQSSPRCVVLKARQLGLSWLTVCFVVHLIRFHPNATVLLFSKRDDEAKNLLERVREVYCRLPHWLQLPAVRGLENSKHTMTLANGARVNALPTTGGRSYTASFVLVDEADYVPDLQALLSAVQPTVDMGGKLVLVSTSDKGKPESLFKNIYRQAVDGKAAFTPVFLPWQARPERTPEWYEEVRRTWLHATGSDDLLYQEYPATDVQALAPRSLDKRIPPQWLQQCYVAAGPAHVPGPYLPRPPALPGLVLYVLPAVGRRYVLGADPAEGNPTSDESAATVLDADSGEEVAFLAGRFQPDTFADYIEQLCVFYHKASALIERNNHGHAVIAALARERKVKLLAGHDTRVGWLSSGKGKALLYSTCAEAFRDQETVIHSFATLQQLQSIEGSTLLAPAGQHDDRADSYALALVAAEKVVGRVGPGKASPTTYKLRT